MDYQKIAGDVLFGANTLDNAMRGLFIEAVVFDALIRQDLETGIDERWRHVGLGWGPWDLQRGTAQRGDRVRVQVKTKAAKQHWKPQKEHEPIYDLGLSKKEMTPSYFTRDFPAETYGDCEASGYRTDFFLLAWHAAEAQSNPNNYSYFVVPADDLRANPAGAPSRLSASYLIANYKATTFSDLAVTLNTAADGFMTLLNANVCP